MSADTQSLELEEKKFALDAEMRRREMELKESEKRRPGLTAAQATVAGGVLTLVSGLAGALIAATSTRNVESDRSLTTLQIEKIKVEGNLDLEKSKQKATEALEQKKFETTLILEAIKTPSRNDAVRNLKFFVTAGFVSDHEDRIKNLGDESLPSIGDPSVLESSFDSDRDPTHLHPTLREKVATLLQRLTQEGLRFEMLEGFRSPSAQLVFFAQGRQGDGPVVTNAKPWATKHNFGLAADLVQIKDKKPYFGSDLSGYQRMHAIAKELDLQTIERPFPDWPHVELPNVSISDLRAGKYPAGGDAAWTSHLTWSIQNWTNLISAIQAWGPELPLAPNNPPPISPAATATGR
jgi:hypothetical protein